MASGVEICVPSDVDDVDAALIDLAESASSMRGGAQGAVLLDRALARWSGVWAESDYRIVARRGSEIVGILAARASESGPWQERSRENAVTVHITVLHVVGKDQRRGVGNALLANVVAYADRIGADHLAVDLPASLGRTHRFYARLGFAPVTSRRSASVAGLRRRLLGETTSRRRFVRLRGAAETDA